MLPYQTEVANSTFKSYQQVVSAYDQIVPGTTPASDLAGMGFDAMRSSNAEVLSYLGVIERFMPRDTIKFDNLDPAVQTCIESRDHCTAYVFKPQRLQEERTGNVLLDMLGFERTTYDHGWSAEVVLLVQDGRVAYKVMSGRPHIAAVRDKVQPLGPFQDLSNVAIRAAGSL